MIRVYLFFLFLPPHASIAPSFLLLMYFGNAALFSFLSTGKCLQKTKIYFLPQW